MKKIKTLRSVKMKGSNRVKDFSSSWGHNTSFNEAIGPVIYCAQFFGVMPLRGVKLANPKDMKFSWYSWRIFGTYAFLLWNFIVLVLSMRYLLQIGITVKNTVGLIFFTLNQCAYFLFMMLARKWPRMMSYWTTMEKKFLMAPYTTGKDNLKRNIMLTALAIGLLSLFEHIMFQVSTIYLFYAKITQCHVITEDIVHLYYLEQYPHVFDALPYSHAIAAMIQVQSFTGTFMWNFMDLFIILISMGLTQRFKQLHERLRWEMTTNNNRPEVFFREIRLDFITLNDILGYVDKEMSFIILLSCLNNLYFICLQLMNIFHKLRFLINYAYFWISLAYLIGRTAYLFMQASAINDASKVPAEILRKTTRRVWCTEIDRFLFQINTETTALSAMGLFHFTRILFFSMVGTIMTYELVILQFDLTSRDHILPPLCA